MKCCLKNCRNNGKVKRLPGSSDWITFHLIPKDPKLRAAWLQALSIPNWMMLNGAAICSDHFKEDDFVLTKQGTRRVKKGVVPFIEGDCTIPVALRACRVCLSLDLKMYQLRDVSLAKCYLDIVGIPPRSDAKYRLPMGICWECTARLESAASFKAKALFTEALLQEHLKNNADLNITDIQNYQREHTNLKPSMAVQEVFKFNSNDFEAHAPNTIKSEAIGIPHNEEIEVEVQNLVMETITIKDESKNVIIEETCPASDVKTEIDLIPITEITIANNQIDFEDLITNNGCIVKENLYAKDNKVTLDNIVLFKSEAINDTATVDLTNNISLEKPGSNVFGDADDNNSNVMGFNDDVVCIGEDDDDAKVVNETVVAGKKKKERNKNAKTAVKKKGTKRTYDDVVIWVKGKRPKNPNKTPYVKPCIPIDENIFTVKTLNHDELRREVLARKDGVHYNVSPYKCEVCYKGFPTQDKQARHMIKHSEQSGSLKCNICYVRVKRVCDLRAHMTKQHTSEFICKLCPLITRSRNVALGHVKYHEGNKFECPQCSIVFEKKTTLLNHLRLKHMSAFVCELCGYTFVSKTGVDIHKRMRHKLFDKNTEFKGQFCEVCDVKFLNEKAYNKHLRLSSKHISEDDPNRISNDPSIKQRRLSTWMYKRHFIRRPVIHRKDANSGPAANQSLTCEQCGEIQESRRAYVTHFKDYHPGIKRTQFSSNPTPYMCEHCGKFFLNTTTLSCHMWVHTGQKGFQCDHCNKTFTMKSNLAGHMQQHEGVRRTYDCRVCGKQFTFSYNRTRHMFLHTGLRPYKCDACEKTFRTSGELRAHVDHVHLKKPRPKRVRRKAKKCEMPNLEY